MNKRGVVFVLVSMAFPSLLGFRAAPLVTMEKNHRAKLAGRVVYADGKPAAGIAVHARSRWSILPQSAFGPDGTISYDGPSSPAERKSAVTRSDGTFEFSGLAETDYAISVAKEPQGFVAAALPDIKPRNDKVLPVRDIVLTRGALVEGRVSDAATGAPLAGVYIMSYGAHRPFQKYLAFEPDVARRTDASGRFSVRVPPGRNYFVVAGPTTILASKAGPMWILRVGKKFYEVPRGRVSWGKVKSAAIPPARRTLETGEGQTRRLDFRLARLAAVRVPRRAAWNLEVQEGAARYTRYTY